MKSKCWSSLAAVLSIVLALSSCGTGSELTPTPRPATATSPPPTAAQTPTDAPPTPTPTPTPTPPPTDTPMPSTLTPEPLELTSGAFEPGESIPMRHACHGENLSPPLTWNNPPDGTESFALVMDDPDAVDVVGYVWDHWLLYNIPPDLRALPEGVPPDPELTDGSLQGENSAGELGYGGPCPPSGQRHEYVFRLYALDTMLNLETGETKDAILKAIEGHVLAEAELVGAYTSP